MHIDHDLAGTHWTGEAVDALAVVEGDVEVATGVDKGLLGETRLAELLAALQLVAVVLVDF